MDRARYYEGLKRLAREKRQHHGVTTETLGLREIRRAYKAEGIQIDLWRRPLRKIRAAYLLIDDEPHVLVNARIKPVEPRLFALCHELKHHYTDQDRARAGRLECHGEYAGYRGVPLIEIGAEVFAAEFIFPEQEFAAWATDHLGKKRCTPEDVVALKRTCPAKVSYTFLTKRLTRLGFAAPGTFKGIRFQKLEEALYGIPWYKRPRRRSGEGISH